MSLATTPSPKLLTAEEFLATPEDGIRRELIDGVIEERGTTARNPTHAGVCSNVDHLLRLWLAGRLEPRGKVVVGDCGFRIRRDPDRVICPDIGFVSAELKARTGRKATYYDGAPALAVEIISPSDRHEDIVQKIGFYLEVGTVVWEVDPDIQTVRVHRPGQVAWTFNVTQDLDADPYLTGFRVAVAAIFED